MKFFLDILLPILVLAALAILLPRWLARVTPETLGGLILNGLISAAILTLLAAGYFFAAHLAQGRTVLDLAGIAPAATLTHFLMLGLASAVIWAPLLVLSVANRPRHWKENTW